MFLNADGDSIDHSQFSATHHMPVLESSSTIIQINFILINAKIDCKYNKVKKNFAKRFYSTAKSKKNPKIPGTCKEIGS